MSRWADTVEPREGPLALTVEVVEPILPTHLVSVPRVFKAQGAPSPLSSVSPSMTQVTHLVDLRSLLRDALP